MSARTAAPAVFASLGLCVARGIEVGDREVGGRRNVLDQQLAADGRAG
jgi:hypothetical protein